jgi:hypothetical protein
LLIKCVPSTIPFMSSCASNKWVTGLVYLYISLGHLWCLFIKIFTLVGNKCLCCKHVVFCPLLRTGPLNYEFAGKSNHRKGLPVSPWPTHHCCGDLANRSFPSCCL